MEGEPELFPETKQFPERIGLDYEMWRRFYDIHGPEAYKWRRLYEDLYKRFDDVLKDAEERGVRLLKTEPDDFT